MTCTLAECGSPIGEANYKSLTACRYIEARTCHMILSDIMYIQKVIANTIFVAIKKSLKTIVFISQDSSKSIECHMPTNQERLESLRDVSSCAYPYAMGRYGRKWQPVYPDSSPFFLFSCLYESQLANAEAIIGPFWYIRFSHNVWACCFCYQFLLNRIERY